MSASGAIANVQAAINAWLALEHRPLLTVDGVYGAKTDDAFELLAQAAKSEHDGGAVASPRFTGIIDLSHGNSLDLAKLKAAGFTAIIHKASQGASFDDSLYQKRKEAAIAAGFLWGAYHFATGADGRAQAANFLGDEAGSDPSILLALDFEPDESGPDMTLQEGRDWINAVADKAGRWPVVYGGGGLLRDLLEGHRDEVFAKCPLWLCDIRPKPQVIAPTWSAWTLLQYCGDGLGQQPMETPGSDGADRNAFAGTADELRAAWPFA